jgi:hypothetical protein
MSTPEPKKIPYNRERIGFIVGDQSHLKNIAVDSRRTTEQLSGANLLAVLYTTLRDIVVVFAALCAVMLLLATVTHARNLCY